MVKTAYIQPSSPVIRTLHDPLMRRFDNVSFGAAEAPALPGTPSPPMTSFLLRSSEMKPRPSWRRNGSHLLLPGLLLKDLRQAITMRAWNEQTHIDTYIYAYTPIAMYMYI